MSDEPVSELESEELEVFGFTVTVVVDVDTEEDDVEDDVEDIVAVTVTIVVEDVEELELESEVGGGELLLDDLFDRINNQEDSYNDADTHPPRLGL